ncbi:putative inositol polyphosphate kinase [Golovinomyces cichoracearum]|uniref:Kinase n=1 Tax=Golovinomyces cichoracearum TaxID=62708 RepID=A0A420IT05_9PEZI|nr:putative inositol polyphosphate kinase [Golovinomyces cichoracearum]
MTQAGFKKDMTRVVTQPQSTEEDEDSGEEQISSALFLPHQMVQETTNISGERIEVFSRSTHPEFSRSEEWLEAHIPSNHDLDTRNLQDNMSQFRIDKADPHRNNLTKENNNLTYPSGKLDSNIDSRDDQFIERSICQTQDNEKTPTGSPKFISPDLEETGKFCLEQQPVTKKPLDAIELIPYSHQVGGHTTLWRFSKRAVCKRLNNRENEFYEKIEQCYPKLLQFLPRYIGVLNVTFEKQSRKQTKNETQDSTPEHKTQQISEQPNHGNDCRTVNSDQKSSGNSKTDHRRVSSLSCAYTQPQRVPTVTFADNRHIIPTSILKPQPIYRHNQARSHSDSTPLGNLIGLDSSNQTVDFNLSKTPVEPNPWGKTYVNKVLREDVFREVFLQRPVSIKHKTSNRNHQFLDSKNKYLRNSNSESNLQKVHQEKKNLQSSLQMDMKTYRDNYATKEATIDTHNYDVANSKNISQAVVNAGEYTGRNQPELETVFTESCNSGKRQRRYSSGGLRLTPAEVIDARGELKYFEETDNGNSGEPYVKESESNYHSSFFQETKLTKPIIEFEHSPAEPSKSTETGSVVGLKPYQSISSVQAEVPRPVNPKEARAQPGSRVEYFLLLEDLTAGMKRPCIIDLKMGSRQYGVDANYKKQQSQREKCAATTSRRLGVRVCGLQVWDASLQDYIFEDKYYGRDLKAGYEFQTALTRFLYDGIDYSSVLRHIPSIIQKLSELEVLIKGLIGYRFYGTSLLMFYDGVTDEGYSSDSTVAGKDDRTVRRDIDFKIADFANCVTKEDSNIERKCPPKYPKKPDMGFLRGLKTLKRYFLAIERDVCSRKESIDFQGNENGRGLNGADENNEEDDEGYVSY